MIVPADDTNDYTPVDAPDIQAGQEVVIQREDSGEVTGVLNPEPGVWLFTLDDGLSFAVFLDDPGALDPWQRVWMYRRQAKPAQGAQFTAADGSRWVFPAQPHGLYRCWQAGTVHGEGLANRSEIEGLVAD